MTLCRRIKNKKAMTLTEMLVSMFIFSVFSLTLFAVFNLSSVLMGMHDANSQITFEGMQVLRLIAREMSQTSYTSDRINISTENGNTAIRFQIPVDYDNDGDIVSGSLTKSVEWGAYDNVGDMQKGTGGSPLNRWAKYSVTNGQLIRQVLDSMFLSVDGLSRVISNNVQSFTVVQNSTTLTITIIFSVQDEVGQSGTARTLQSTFTHKILLRNVPT